MIIDGQNFTVEDIFDNSLTIPDCFVLGKNKLGHGHGEAKFYIASKDKMHDFFGDNGFHANCFILKQDLLAYMNAIKDEYITPSLNYVGKDVLPELWSKRVEKINTYPEIIEFTIDDQPQIDGTRGYINFNDEPYKLIREISLPLVSYVSVMKLKDPQNSTIYYWKLFADRVMIANKRNGALVFNYGKGKTPQLTPAAVIPQPKNQEIGQARIGQGKYRELLLEEMPFCPITRINDERLLIASHAKPWAESNDKEKIDPKNGLILSPLFDRLFDKGFMTFTDDKRMKLSNWITPKNYERMGLNINEEKYIELLPFDEQRLVYIKYHREKVFKG